MRACVSVLMCLQEHGREVYEDQSTGVLPQAPSSPVSDVVCLFVLDQVFHWLGDHCQA